MKYYAPEKSRKKASANLQKCAKIIIDVPLKYIGEKILHAKCQNEKKFTRRKPIRFLERETIRKNNSIFKDGK